MKKLNTLFFFFFLSLRAIAQVTNTSIYSFEEIKPKSLKGELGLLLSTSFAQNDTYASFRSMFNSKFAYIAQKNDYRLNISNYISINDDGKLTYKNDFLFKLGFEKYYTDAAGVFRRRNMYGELVFAVQNRSDAGLNGRHQTGVLFHPLLYMGKIFNINIGIGAVYNRANWDVNNKKEIEDCTPALQEKIKIVNASLNLKNGKYYIDHGVEAMMYVRIALEPVKNFKINLTSTFQQGTTPAYTPWILSLYPDLRKNYPWFTADLQLSYNFTKNFGLSTQAYLDYDNGGMALWASKYQYMLLVGVNWKFGLAQK